MQYQVFVYDDRLKTVQVSGGLTEEQAEDTAAECGGWIEVEK